MKSINAIVHLILFAAIVVLYILHFTARPAPLQTTSASDSLRVKMTDVSADGSANILFVNSDSLWNNYEYVKTLEKSVEQEKSRMEGQLIQRQKKWENAMKDLQTKYQAGQMTMEAAAQREQELMTERESLLKLEEDLTRKLMENTEEKNRLLEQAILDYLRKYNLDRNVSYILGYQRGGVILFGKDSLDITHEVLEGLNTEYRDSLARVSAKVIN